MAKVVRGKYNFKSDSLSKKEKKRLKEKEQRKLLQKQDKEMKIMCDCNHLDAKKNKTHFKYSNDGMFKTCKICGGKIINDPQLLTEESVKSAVDTIYSVYAIVRNRLNISEDTDRQITKTLLYVMRCPDLLKLVKDDSKDSKKKKNKKDKKNKNKKSFNRISY